jgi:hypothetical protein
MIEILIKFSSGFVRDFISVSRDFVSVSGIRLRLHFAISRWGLRPQAPIKNYGDNK